MGTQDIVAKLWNLCNVLRDDGITYHQYVTELTYILFLKMINETDEEARFKSDVQKNYADRLAGFARKRGRQRTRLRKKKRIILKGYCLTIRGIILLRWKVTS